jgi:hypothetical protein
MHALDKANLHMCPPTCFCARRHSTVIKPYRALPGWAAAMVVDRAAETVEVSWQEWDAEAQVWP